MNRSRQGSNPESLQIPHFQNDARVEILLFLGIAFWCWMLVCFFLGRFAAPLDNSLTLTWNGRALQMEAGEIPASGMNDTPGPVPAEFTPFLFQPLPVNFADPELLATISGIGPKLATQIVATRKTRGLFTEPQDLLAVPGIGRSRMTRFASQFSFSVIP